MRDPDRSSPDALRLSRRQALSAGVAASFAPLGCRGKSGDTADGSDSGTSSGAASRSPEPDAWDPGGTEDRARFPFGVQVGDATASSAIVHLRTHSGPVTMVLAEGSETTWEEVDRRGGLEVSAIPVEADPVGMAVVVELDGLSPDTPYSVVFFDGDARSSVTRFRTALDEGGLRKVVFGATSCFGGNDPWPSLAFAAAEKLDFFSILGDTVYADGSATPAQYRAFWDQALSTQGLLQLSASTSLVCTWDDHEVDNNWDISTVGEARYQIAKACFDEALPRSEGPGGTGVWRELRWGDTVHAFVLDGRAERRPEAGIYLSDEQLQWLIDGVKSSTARFKIIFNSVPITDLMTIFSTIGLDDRWDGFPATRTALLEGIAGVQGVLFVTGDVHYAQVGFVDPAGGVADGVYEVFTGPVGSFLNVAADIFVGDPQYLWMAGTWNWCRFECDPVAGTIQVTHIGDDGSALHDITLEL